MRQITDGNGNVLPEPYLTMANDNYNQEYNDRLATSGCENNLANYFDWDRSPQKYSFWVAVDRGDCPNLPAEEPGPTIQAARASRKIIERKFEAMIAEFEDDNSGVTISIIALSRACGKITVEVRANV